VLGRWLFRKENRPKVKILGALLLGYIAFVVALALWDPALPEFLGEGAKGAAEEEISAADLAVVIASVVVFGWLVPTVIHLKADNIRLEEMLFDVHGSAYQDELWRQHNEERRQWYRERDEWKAKTQAELYEAILDQVERGVLKPRPEYPDDDYKYPNVG
jgi:hypothetical protein